jgi:hypothetical protein
MPAVATPMKEARATTVITSFILMRLPRTDELTPMQKIKGKRMMSVQCGTVAYEHQVQVAQSATKSLL